MTPFLKIDNNNNVIELSDSFNKCVMEIKIGDNVVSRATQDFKHVQWEIAVKKFLNDTNSFDLSNIVFIPKNKFINNEVVPVVQYWYLQLFTLNEYRYIVFHSNKADQALDSVFSDFVNYVRSNHNDVEFYFHRKTRLDKKYIVLNPWLYAFFMPHLAKSNFHLAQDQLFRDFFDINPELRVKGAIQIELDNLIISDRHVDVRKFKQKYLNQNYIPYTKLAYPLIVTLENKND